MSSNKKTMKITLAFFAVLLTATTAPAQSVSPDPRFAVKMQKDSEDSIASKFTITNQSQIPITAVLIACDDPFSADGPPRYVRSLSDTVIDDSFQIAYQESSTFAVHTPDWASMTCKQGSSVRAILFADGSSFGGSEWVNEILQQRQFTWKAVTNLLDVLQRAVTSKTTKAQLSAQLLKLMRGPFPISMPDGSVASGHTPSIFFVVSRNLGRARENANDSPVPQSLIDDLSAPLLDLRQLIQYAKPAIPGLPQNLDPAAAPPPDFTIKFPDGLVPDGKDFSIGDMISVFYEINATGQKKKDLFDRFSADDEPTLKIHALVAGHPASSMKVAIYAPGCQIQTTNVPDPATYSANKVFACIKLPTVKFTGQILASDLLLDKKCKVQIQLHDPGNMESPSFDVDLADDIAPDENGFFQIEIPDYSQDPVSSSHSATLHFLAGEFRLSAENGSADSKGDLRLSSDYGGPVSFQPRPKEK